MKMSNPGAISLKNAGCWSHIRNGEPCRIYMGAGWQKGTVASKLTDSVMVQLPTRLVRCFDPRNVRPG